MKNPRLAQRYAKALFDFALERNELEEVSKDLNNIRSLLRDNRELLNVLNSPVITPAKKHAVFAAIFQGNVHETTFLFLDTIIRKKREPALATICDEFQTLYNQHHRIKSVTLTTAQPLDAQLLEQIRTMLAEQTGYTIEIKEVIQPDLIGGIIVKMDDYYFDASVLARINKLKQEFAHNVYQVNF